MSDIVETEAFSISPGLLEALKKQGATKIYPAETVMIDDNEYVKSIPIVLSGAVKVSRLDEDGNEILLYYIKPGESCVMSFLGALCNGASKIKAVVEEDAEILMLPIHKATDLIRENPQWLEFIFQLYNKRFEELLSVVNAIAFQNIDDRLWELIMTKVKLFKTKELNTTHQQLAYELGTAREVVSRLLKQLENEGKIGLSRNKIKVIAEV